MEEHQSWKTADEFFLPGKDLPPNARQRCANAAKALQHLANLKSRLASGSAPSAADEDFIVKRSCFDAVAFCEQYQKISSVLNDIGQEIKLQSVDLASLFRKTCYEITEYVASLLAHTCRTVRLQESFCSLVSKCRYDAAISHESVRRLRTEMEQYKIQVERLQNDDAQMIESLRKEIQSFKDEAERIELEGNRPSWQWQADANDPTKVTTSKAWYEAELSYLQNISSQREMQHDLLLEHCDAFRVRAESAEDQSIQQQESLQKLKEELDVLKISLAEKDKSKECAACQTNSEEILLIHNVKPAVIARGDTIPPYPITVSLRRTGEHRAGFATMAFSLKLDMTLPSSFHMIYEMDNRRQPEATRRGGRRSSIAMNQPLVLAVPAFMKAATENTTAKRPGKVVQVEYYPLQEVIDGVLQKSAEGVVMNLRTTSRQIGEVWAASLAAIDNAAQDHFGMNTTVACNKEYGSRRITEEHLSDLVASLVHYRDKYPRARIFSEFIGVDAEMSQKALSIFLMFYYQIKESLRVDDDNGVVWTSLKFARKKASAFLKSRQLSDADIENWLQNVAAGTKVPDPANPSEILVDADSFTEALRNLIMLSDNQVHEDFSAAMCERAVEEHLISLPRFLALMAQLNNRFDHKEAVEYFEYVHGRKVEEFGKDALAAMDFHDFTLFARANISKIEDPVEFGDSGQIRWALNHFWYSQARRLRQSLEDLRKKEHNLSTSLDRFKEVYRKAEPSDIAEGWILARNMMAQVLTAYVAEPPPPAEKPRQSFFRSKDRKLHIMQALLPRTGSQMARLGLIVQSPKEGKQEAAHPSKRVPLEI